MNTKKRKKSLARPPGSESESLAENFCCCYNEQHKGALRFLAPQEARALTTRAKLNFCCFACLLQTTNVGQSDFFSKSPVLVQGPSGL